MTKGTLAALATLDPAFRGTVERVLARSAEATGVEWIVTEGRRTMARQAELFAQGRTAPGRVVTKARPGSSSHNFGLGADLCPLKDGKAWWEAPKTIWQQMADLAEEEGLEAGFYFQTIFDAPHIESPAWKTAQAEWKAGRVQLA